MTPTFERLDELGRDPEQPWVLLRGDNVLYLRREPERILCAVCQRRVRLAKLGPNSAIVEVQAVASGGALGPEVIVFVDHKCEGAPEGDLYAVTRRALSTERHPERPGKRSVPRAEA